MSNYPDSMNPSDDPAFQDELECHWIEVPCDVSIWASRKAEVMDIIRELNTLRRNGEDLIEIVPDFGWEATDE